LEGGLGYTCFRRAGKPQDNFLEDGDCGLPLALLDEVSSLLEE
jgi:hypothetical protein